MSETIVAGLENTDGENSEGVTPEEESTAETAAPEDDFKSEESKKAVLADLAKERAARKDLQSKVEQFEQAQQEAEKAKLSDIERAQSEAKEAAKRAEKAEAALLKVSIASTHGITDQDDIELFLTGADEDTLTRQAKRLAERNSGPTSPKPDHSQGPKGSENLTDAEKITAAQQAGDKEAIARLKAQQLGNLAKLT